MLGTYKKIATSNVLPISLAEVKEHLRLQPDDSQEDETLLLYIKSALQQAENLTQRSVFEANYVYSLDSFPEEIEIRKEDVQTVVRVSYFDSFKEKVNIELEDLEINTAYPVRIKPVSGSRFPTTYPVNYTGVEVEFTTAMVQTAAELPEDFKHALLLMIGAAYENREDKRGNAQMHKASELLLFPYRLIEFV